MRKVPPRDKPVPIKNGAVQIQRRHSRRLKINKEILIETIPSRQIAPDFERLTREGLETPPQLVAEGSGSVWLYNKAGVNRLQKKSRNVTYCLCCQRVSTRAKDPVQQRLPAVKRTLHIQLCQVLCLPVPSTAPTPSCTSLTNLLMQVHGV